MYFPSHIDLQGAIFSDATNFPGVSRRYLVPTAGSGKALVVYCTSSNMPFTPLNPDSYDSILWLMLALQGSKLTATQTSVISYSYWLEADINRCMPTLPS